MPPLLSPSAFFAIVGLHQQMKRRAARISWRGSKGHSYSKVTKGGFDHTAAAA